MTLASQRRHRDRNRTFPCSVNGCPNRRAWSSRYCSKHAKRRKLYGHPLGRSLKKRELKDYTEQARSFIIQHQNSPQIEAAYQFFDDLLKLGNPDGSDAEKELYRLGTLHGLYPEEALDAVLPIWLYSMAEPRALPDDERLTYALGIALLKSKTVFNQRTNSANRNYQRRYFTPTGAARREIGEAIRSRLGLFFSNVVAFFRELERKRREQVEALAQPFTIINP